ncbi:MAG: UDP-2,3-diacylglucosamine diphosphatase [Methanoregula sp.]|jgi:UDP-2,3-diacylglucosamine pyrophosphatase LpxH|uniref:UDP-2,3-diacylglucosamine diphosphatase n=1 Tax=Methanoregula sp. TaxID=2052170 RepID=UPI0025E21B74|nr:UDP-2,3-diacylglucosamine diphosphatase [Methanoregula sp.]MCK9630999.1 UDP-2,3-diacylglucosamine diphosphatase [Methanoregula sp.]
MIIAVSDVHLGWDDDKENVKKQDEFLDFLNYCDTSKIDHLVLLGDIFDFWARSNARIFSTGSQDAAIRKIVKTNEEIFSRLTSLHAKEVHYVVGNHDYLVHDLHATNPETYPFSIDKKLRLSDGGKNFFFTHGYDLDVRVNMELFKMSVDSYEKTCFALSFMTDRTGWAAVNGWGLGEKISQFMDALKYMNTEPAKRKECYAAVELLANSRAAGLFLGMRPGDNLVYGHTHRPYYAQCAGGYEVANTGFWAGKSSRDDKDVNTYVKIDNGRMSQCTFTGDDIFRQKCS